MAFTEQLRFGSNWPYYGDGYTIQTNFVLYWEETTSVADNASTIRFYVTTSQSPIGSGYKRTVSSGNVTINGKQYNFTTGSVYNGVNVVGSSSNPFSITVLHDNDGTKSINISMTANVGGDSKTASATKTLTAIPRANEMSIASAVTINNTTGNIPVTITRKNSSSYSRLYYSMSNGKSGNANIGTATSASYTYASLLDLIAQPSVTMDVTLVTYSDSSYATEIGRTRSYPVIITVDTSVIKPSISLSDITKNSGNISSLVAGYSKAETSYTVTQARGNPGYDVAWTADKCSIDTKSGTKGITGTLPPSTSNYTITITCTVTDNRGGWASASKTATVYGYSRPNFTLSAFRCVSTSDGNADIAGTAVSYSRSAVTYTAISGNSLTVAFNRGSTSISTSSAAQSGRFALAQDASVTITCTATDTVSGATTQSINIAVASFPLDLYQSGNDVGVGFGTIASSGRVESGLPIKENKGHYVHQAHGTEGTGGYVKIARLTVISNWANQPIEFTIAHRGDETHSTVIVRFNGEDSTDPSLYAFYSTSGYMALQKESTSTWAIISQKSGGYDRVEITDFKMGRYMSDRVQVTWIDEYIGASLPTTGIHYMTEPVYRIISKTANNIDIVNSAGTTNAGWKTDENGNLVHKRTTASDTFNIMSNNATKKWSLTWEDGNVATYGQYMFLRYGHDNNTSYLANNTNGVYLTANTSGESVYIETKDTQIHHRKNGTNYAIITLDNLKNSCKKLYSGSLNLASSTQITITNGALYLELAFIIKLPSDVNARQWINVPVSDVYDYTSKQSWYHSTSGSSEWSGVYLWRSGNNIICCGGASTSSAFGGTLYAVYGIGGSW